MSYTYLRNTDPSNRFDQIEFMRDDGTTAEVIMGLRYNLSPTELARLIPHIVLEYSALPASGEPIGIYRIPIKGNPDEGQVPVWREVDGVFVPQNIDIAAGIIGGSNLIPNPSFSDGVTGYTAGLNNTLAANSLVGQYGPEAAAVTRTTSTGSVILTSAAALVDPLEIYSGSLSLRRVGGTSPTARTVTTRIRWYDAIDTFISAVETTSLDSPQFEWLRPGVASQMAPDTASKARLEVEIAGVPSGETYYFDGFQLELGMNSSNYEADFAASTLTGAMLKPGAITYRELSTDLIDSLVASVIAGMPAAAFSGFYDFPYSIDPRNCDNNRTVTANNLYFYRVQGAGTISNLLFNVGTSDAAATAYAGVYTNVGAGRSARPSAHVAHGSVSLSGAGLKTVSLGATITVHHGDWFAFGSTSATATYLSSAPNASTVLTQGLSHFQTAILPTIPDPVGTLSDYLNTICLVGS